MAGLVATSRVGLEVAPGPNLSDEAKRVAQLLSDLRKPSPASLQSAVTKQELDARVFDALATVKILTAFVAMHLKRESRDRLFSQLDALHETEQWEAGDEPVNPSSYETFLKAILAIRPERRPGLGLSHAGDLIGAWTSGRDRLTIDFLPKGQVRWVLSRYRDEGEPERFAGQVGISRLAEVLAPHHPEHWFSNESLEQSSRR